MGGGGKGSRGAEDRTDKDETGRLLGAKQRKLPGRRDTVSR